MVVVAVGIELAGGELVEARSISNLAFKVPPTVVRIAMLKTQLPWLAEGESAAQLPFFGPRI